MTSVTSAKEQMKHERERTWYGLHEPRHEFLYFGFDREIQLIKDGVNLAHSRLDSSLYNIPDEEKHLS